MKQFKYQVYDSLGLVRNHDSKWDAYNQAKQGADMYVKVNQIPKPNHFVDSLNRLGEALI